MQLTELRATLKRLLDEDSVYRPDAVLDNSINDGYQLASALTQACERTTTFTYRTATGGYCSFVPADFFLPVSVYAGTTRMEPIRITDLNMLTTSWLNDAASEPLYYWTLGALGPTPTIWLYPRPAADTRIRMTYASIPDRLTNDASIPRIPTEYHYIMVQYAYAWELLKERGALLANKAYREFNKFSAQVNDLRMIVYRRAPDRDWQMMPWDHEATKRKMFSADTAKGAQQQQPEEVRDLTL